MIIFPFYSLPLKKQRTLMMVLQWIQNGVKIQIGKHYQKSTMKCLHKWETNNFDDIVTVKWILFLVDEIDSFISNYDATKHQILGKNILKIWFSMRTSQKLYGNFMRFTLKIYAKYSYWMNKWSSMLTALLMRRVL